MAAHLPSCCFPPLPQAALRTGAQQGAALLRALGPALPFPGELAAMVVVVVVVSDQVYTALDPHASSSH